MYARRVTSPRRTHRATGAALVVAVALAPAAAWAWNPLSTLDDPLVRQPGTQPLDGVGISGYTNCAGCHAGFAPAVEPGFAWKGSMMAQAARDPLFFAAMTVAAQDSIWALGRPNAVDTCERCHFPAGWLAARSDPPNAAAMTGADYEGVGCDLCHRMYDPFYRDGFDGMREGSDWPGYWDEQNLGAVTSQDGAVETLAADQLEAATVALFNGQTFYDATEHPKSASYVENASGQYFVSTSGDRRASFADASAMHPTLYSRYHKSKYFCSTCHDVSNPALANAAFSGTQPLDGVTVLPSESQPAHGYFAVERTFSELMLSDYGLPGGAPGVGPFAPGVFDTSRPGDAIATCQDCHMPDRSGKACDKASGVLRPSGSVEHPSSGQPVHELTGGNAWVPYLLASALPGSPVYDPVNEAILGQGPAALTLDLTQGIGLDPLALLAGRTRAIEQLRRAAAIEALSYDPATGALAFRIRNQTGHKLITGYPEGRRMFVNVRLYAGGALVAEVNPYDDGSATLKGLPPAYSPASPALGPGESYADALVYEARSKSSLTGEAESFHFVLATGHAKDNRIPPKGFRIAEAGARLAEPASQGAPAPGYFTAAEYAGGWDDVALALPAGGENVVVRLYYQTTSREYVEFLRDEINGTASTLASPTPSGEPAAYVAQSDLFFGGLAAWGDAIWQLWDHNKSVPGAAPVLMAQASLLASDPCADPLTPDGTACDDADACTVGDACAGGACVGGAAPPCDDGNACTDDACDAALGCVFTANAGACEDGNACTAMDACSGGVCVPGPPLSCGDSNICTDDSCDPAIGCVHVPSPSPQCADGGGATS